MNFTLKCLAAGALMAIGYVGFCEAAIKTFELMDKFKNMS